MKENGFSFRPRVLIALVVVVALVCVLWFLFRVTKHDNPSLGMISYHYRWGRYVEQSVDVNRDGVDDGRYIVEPGSVAGSTATKVVDCWESTKMDGQFDLHYWYESPNRRLALEHDSNNDGKFDKQLKGKEAETYRQIVFAKRNSALLLP